MLTNTQFQKPEKAPWIRSMLPPVVAAVLLMLALTQWLQWGPAFLYPVRSAVFRMQNGAWQRLPELPGAPEKLQVSTGGAVWALISHYGVGHELARLDGTSWRIYTSAHFGTRAVDATAGFVLDGEEVWAATDKGVLHWDGHRWKCYAEAIGSADVSSIVAANGKVWVIDRKGNLSHFDGSQWKVQKVELPGAKWDDNPDADWPDLARTGDGSLWIVHNGLWRSDGREWVAVKPDGDDFKDASLVGSTSEGVWMWDGESLELVGPNEVLEEFEPDEMGLVSGEVVNEVDETAHRIDVATSRGILEFDGAVWRRMAAPQKGVRAVLSIRASAGGQLFAIGNVSKPGAGRWRSLVPAVTIALMLGTLAIPVWMVRRYKHHRLREHQRLQHAVEYATGAVPEDFARDERLLSKQSSWWSATVAVGVVVGAMAGYSITQSFWPKAPSWMFLVIALALHIVVTLGQSMVKRTPKLWDPIQPGGPPFDWAPTRRTLPGSLVVFILLNFTEVWKWIGDPVVWVLYGILAVTWYKAFESMVFVSAINRGDYERGLKVIRRFHFYNPEGGAALSRRGHLLLSAGRFREAEEALRGAVAGLRSRTGQAHALEFLGDALLEQGRYDEAMRSYEAALHAVPGFRRPYRGMAELMLRRGRDAARAWEYVENIMGPSGGRSWNPWSINGKASDDYWSLRAWALAELGRGAEVAPAVAAAIQATNPKSKPDLATTYRRLGLAMQAMDRQAESEEYLKEARDADPHGRWSRLAKAALAQRSVWKV